MAHSCLVLSGSLLLRCKINKFLILVHKVFFSFQLQLHQVSNNSDVIMKPLLLSANECHHLWRSSGFCSCQCLLGEEKKNENNRSILVLRTNYC